MGSFKIQEKIEKTLEFAANFQREASAVIEFCVSVFLINQKLFWRTSFKSKRPKTLLVIMFRYVSIFSHHPEV